MNTKQVIVIRKDLNMRKGKMCAQASHASMSFLTKAGAVTCVPHTFRGMYFRTGDLLGHDVEIDHWLENSFKKVVCSVDSEEALVALHEKAITLGLVSHLVTDNGATEFNGVPTKTCLAIGPHWDDKFIDLTNHLPLL